MATWLKKRTRARRGLSTVVTSIILVSAVSMMGSFLVSWSNSSFTQQRISIGDLANDRVNAAKENFIVEDVWFFTNATGRYFNVTVQNTGAVAINVTEVYMDSAKHTEKQVIPAGQVGVIDVEANWVAGTSYTILVKTERENAITQTWMA